MAHVKTIADVKREHAKAGGYFFSPGAMQSFNSRIESGLLRYDFFITSEQFDDDAPRRYTVRKWDRDDPIDIITFDRFATLNDAYEGAAIMILTEQGEDTPEHYEWIRQHTVAPV